MRHGRRASRSKGKKAVPSAADIFDAQKEFLETYEEASHEWISRARSEIDLWSEFATKLAASRSVPSAMDTVQECVAKRIKMASSDGQQLLAGSSKFVQTLTRSLSNGGRG
jgi:hypothetical protein